MNKAYTPISCEIYSRYELAILRGLRLRVAWRGGRSRLRIESLRPADLRTHRGAEYMIARSRTGRARVLRLDRIVSTHIL